MNQAMDMVTMNILEQAMVFICWQMELPDEDVYRHLQRGP
jgi:hypothetical protein